MSATGRADVRQKDDFYATPAWATRAILPHLDLSGYILEPCAGRGAIVAELLHAGVPPNRIVANELDPGRAGMCGQATEVETFNSDFLSPDLVGTGAGLVITNPPYVLAEKFIRHAMKNTSPTGEVAMLLRLNFLASKKRIPFWQKYPAHVYVLPLRPSFSAVVRDLYQCLTCKRKWKVMFEADPCDVPPEDKCTCGEYPVFRKTIKTTHDACEYGWFVFGPRRQRRWDVLGLDGGGDDASIPRIDHRRISDNIRAAEGHEHAG